MDRILLQHPVPPHVDERAAFEATVPGNDHDRLTRTSFAAMAFDEPAGFQSCTPNAVSRLLDPYYVSLAASRAVVAGRSTILGKPAGALLLARDATIPLHSRSFRGGEDGAFGYPLHPSPLHQVPQPACIFDRMQ